MVRTEYSIVKMLGVRLCQLLYDELWGHWLQFRTPGEYVQVEANHTLGRSGVTSHRLL